MRRALGLLVLSAAFACGNATPQSQGLLTPPGNSGSGGGSASGSEGTSGSSGSESSGSDVSGQTGGSAGSNSGSSTGSVSSGSGSSSGSSRSGSSGSSSGSTHKADAGSSGLSGGGTMPTSLPTAKGTCSPLTTGMNSITVNGKAMTWSIWVGQKSTSGSGGPVIIYWHGTGTNGSEVMAGLGQAAITEIQGMGGVVASAETTSSTGTNTGDNVWYTGDFDYADQIIACAMQQFTIDTRHIHVAGYSAGALQTATMFYAKSGYIASVTVYSGGAAFPAMNQDPSNHIPVLGAHGSTSQDFLASSTTMWESTVKSAGSFVIDCDDGGSHVDITRLTRLGPSAWLFFKTHPFGIGMPDPYAGGIPSSFPTYCKII